MYICPTCGKKVELEADMQKHYLSCWKEKNPYHPSKAAPRSEDVTAREISEDIANFFNSFNKR